MKIKTKHSKHKHNYFLLPDDSRKCLCGKQDRKGTFSEALEKKARGGVAHRHVV